MGFVRTKRLVDGEWVIMTNLAYNYKTKPVGGYPTKRQYNKMMKKKGIPPGGMELLYDQNGLPYVGRREE